jgi:ATP-dependent DNA helicase RecG
MQTMVSTNDEIAEVDLKLRGPGNLMGTQQSGVLNLQIADMFGTEIFGLEKSHKNSY